MTLFYMSCDHNSTIGYKIKGTESYWSYPSLVMWDSKSSTLDIDNQYALTILQIQNSMSVPSHMLRSTPPKKTNCRTYNLKQNMFMLETVSSLALWIGLGEREQTEWDHCSGNQGRIADQQPFNGISARWKRVVKWCNCTETTRNSDNCF